MNESVIVRNFSCTCSKCGNVFLKNAPYFVDSFADKNLLDEVKSGEILFIECPKCKTKLLVPGFVYFDSTLNKKVIYYPSIKERKIDFNFYNPIGFDYLSEYVVLNPTDFVNCIYALEHNIDWYLFGIYLTYCLFLFQKKCKEKGFDYLRGYRGPVIIKNGEKDEIYIELLYEDYMNTFVIDFDFMNLLKKLFYEQVLSDVKNKHYIDYAFIGRLLRDRKDLPL